MEQLIALTQGEQLAQASAMLGATVEVDANTISLQGGQGEIRFDADGTSRYQVAVLDSSGRAIQQQTVSASAGTASWSWDGRAADGRAVANGAYRATVTQLGTDGTVTQVPFRTVATATGAERKGSSLELALGDLTVGFEKVRRILQPAP
jgi:flagellar basal-body rod modification protein FlgD